MKPPYSILLRVGLFFIGLWVRLNDFLHALRKPEPTAPDPISPLTRLERAHKAYGSYLSFGKPEDLIVARDEASKAAKELGRLVG